MSTDWDMLMNDIRTFKRITYKLTDGGYLVRQKFMDKKGYFISTKLLNPDIFKVYPKPPCQTYRENYLVNVMFHNKWITHKEKKEYLKMNKIKGYSKCTNHRELNRLMMSF